MTNFQNQVQRLFLIISLLLFATQPILAQTELLSGGAYGTTIQGGLEARESKVFSIRGTKGQILKAQVRNKDRKKVKLSLELSDSSGKSVLNGLDRMSKLSSLDVVLPSEDKFILTIRGGSRKSSYILEVSLDDPQNADSPEPWFPFKIEAPSLFP